MTLARITPEVYDPMPARRSWVDLMAPAVELAKAIAATDFVPRAMRNNPAAISAAILYGDEVGLGPMQSLAKIAVIEGRPFVAAEAQRALVLAAGHQLWIEDATNTRVTWCGRRAGTDEIIRITWTMDDARRARLDGKPNWRSYPRQMLSARASAELVRAAFADAVGGLGAIEEAEDAPVVADVDALGRSAPASATQKRRRRTPATVPPAAAAPAHMEVPPDGPPLPPLPGEVDAEVEVEPITAAQSRRMYALFRARGIDDRPERLTLTREVIGRTDLTGSKDLTRAEADRLLDYLESTPPPEDLAQEALDLGTGDQ
jgi:hypothetical protein